MSQIGTGRWDTGGDETKPFGMSFVDLVASALICVIALLIVWLQFIDPLGIVPGRGPREGAGAQGTQGPSALDDAAHGGPRLYLLSAVAVGWTGDDDERLPATVKVSCRSGQTQSATVKPGTIGFATISFRFDTGVEGCVLRIELENPVTSRMDVTVQSIAEGRHFYQVRKALERGDRSWDYSLISDADEQRFKAGLGLKPTDAWAFEWAPK